MKIVQEYFTCLI